MQTQRRITHEAQVNAPCAWVGLVAIKSARRIVLRNLRRVTDRLPEANVMIKPMRTTRPCTDKPHARQRKNAAHDIVRRIPVAVPASEEHGENGFNVVFIELGRRAVVILARVAKPTDAAVAARPTTV